MSGGFSHSESASKSKSSSQSYVMQQQIPFLQELWSGGSTLMAQQAGIGQDAQALSSGLLGQGQQFLGGLGNNSFLDSLRAQSGGNPELVGQQMDVLGNRINQLSGRQMAQAGQFGVNAGAYGQSGNQIANGLIGEEAIRSFTEGATQLQTADAQRALQASISGGGLMGQQAAIGLNSLGSLYGLGMSPYSAQWMPLQAQTGLVGSPVVLGSSQSKGWSHGHSAGGNFSFGGMG